MTCQFGKKIITHLFRADQLMRKRGIIFILHISQAVLHFSLLVS